MAIRVVGLGALSVLEGAAADGIDSDENHDHDNVEHRQLVPAPPHVFQHPRLARVTLVAQDRRHIVPPVAVRVLCHHRRRIVARRWGLAAPRLRPPP